MLYCYPLHNCKILHKRGRYPLAFVSSQIHDDVATFFIDIFLTFWILTTCTCCILYLLEKLLIYTVSNTHIIYKEKKMVVLSLSVGILVECFAANLYSFTSEWRGLKWWIECLGFNSFFLLVWYLKNYGALHYKRNCIEINIYSCCMWSKVWMSVNWSMLSDIYFVVSYFYRTILS